MQCSWFQTARFGPSCRPFLPSYQLRGYCACWQRQTSSCTPRVTHLGRTLGQLQPRQPPPVPLQPSLNLLSVPVLVLGAPHDIQVLDHHPSHAFFSSAKEGSSRVASSKWLLMRLEVGKSIWHFVPLPVRCSQFLKTASASMRDARPSVRPLWLKASRASSTAPLG